jgi:hypothetical protein
VAQGISSFSLKSLVSIGLLLSCLLHIFIKQFYTKGGRKEVKKCGCKKRFTTRLKIKEMLLKYFE